MNHHRNWKRKVTAAFILYLLSFFHYPSCGLLIQHETLKWLSVKAVSPCKTFAYKAWCFRVPVNLLMGSISVERRSTRINCTVMDNTVPRQSVNNSALMEAVYSSSMQVKIKSPERDEQNCQCHISRTIENLSLDQEFVKQWEEKMFISKKISLSWLSFSSFKADNEPLRFLLVSNKGPAAFIQEESIITIPSLAIIAYHFGLHAVIVLSSPPPTRRLPHLGRSTHRIPESGGRCRYPPDTWSCRSLRALKFRSKRARSRTRVASAPTTVCLRAVHGYAVMPRTVSSSALVLLMVVVVVMMFMGASGKS